MLYELIQNAQKGNKEAMLELINRFSPLFKKYAKKLNYEDAYEDIVLYFIKLVKIFKLSEMKNSEEAAIVSYINIAVVNFYHKSVYKAVKDKKEIAISVLTEEQRYYIESLLVKSDVPDILLELKGKDFLDEKEYKLLSMIYVEDYSVAEIARMYNKTRQSVNQMKQRILKKLRKVMQ